MVPLLSNRGPNNVVEIQQFLTEAETLLALPKAFDSSHLTEALKVLEKDGLIVMQGTELLIGDIGTPTELGKDANRLVDGVIARAKIRNRDSSLEGDRTLLEQIIVSSLALDGLHLAHTLMRQQPLDNDRLEAVVHEAISKIKFPLQHVAVARSSIVELITSPDPEEEQILVNISAVVFGTALLLGDPLSIDRASSAFQRGAYVDASVILPWLALGHPLQQAYDSILRSFDTKSIRVLAGYLNEVISHKRLALDAYEKIAGQGDTDVFRRYASLFELHNINVFLGGFAGTLELSQGETFGEYLSRVAPFDSEAELKRYLELRGLTVEDHTVRDRGIFGELKAALRDRSKFREDVVIAHDAAQLEVLRAVTEREARPHFVTADRALIRAASETSLRYLIPNILLPQQVAFLARMADRTTAGLQAFSRTLWTVGTTVADKIRRYYSDRILREYEAGLVEEIDTILDAIMKDMRNDGVDLSAETTKDPHLESERIKIFGRIDRFEPRFFQHMAEARERLKRDQE
jgi:hypothetical protein